MSSAPDFDYWRQFHTLRAWEISALLHGVDPRAVGDVMVKGTDPKNEYGDPLDLSDALRRVTSAIDAGLMSGLNSPATSASRETEVAVESMHNWLLHIGQHELAKEFFGQVQHTQTNAARTGKPVSEPQRRLAELRRLKGDVIRCNRTKSGWKAVKLKDLIKSEAACDHGRLDPKTVRRDLFSAAEEEWQAQKDGQPGLQWPPSMPRK